MGRGEFYESIMQEVPESMDVRAGLLRSEDRLGDGVGGFLGGCFVVEV